MDAETFAFGSAANDRGAERHTKFRQIRADRVVVIGRHLDREVINVVTVRAGGGTALEA